MVRKIPNRCAARRADERQCYSTGVVVLVGVPFCQPHAEELARTIGVQLDPVRVVEIAGSAPHVVYYAGDPDTQLVKIGTSHDFTRRYVALRSRHPGLALLAVEPGHFDLESARHRQFKHLRVSSRGAQREWFRKADDLMQHVNEVRARWGDPFQYRPPR